MLLSYSHAWLPISYLRNSLRTTGWLVGVNRGAKVVRCFGVFNSPFESGVEDLGVCNQCENMTSALFSVNQAFSGGYTQRSSLVCDKRSAASATGRASHAET